MTTPSNRPTKAEQRRVAILESAERLFALYGYNATRLEDVAEEAGLKRPALFYHFSDKQTLYHTTLTNAFGSLSNQLEKALMGTGSIAERFENATVALIDEIAERPSLGRLILRYVTDPGEQQEQSIYPESNRLVQTAWELFNQGCESGGLKPLHDQPFHAACMVIGSTVFYSSAITKLIPSGGFDPSSAEHIAGQKNETLQVVRFLLGISPTSREKSEP